MTNDEKPRTVRGRAAMTDPVKMARAALRAWALAPRDMGHPLDESADHQAAKHALVVLDELDRLENELAQARGRIAVIASLAQGESEISFGDPLDALHEAMRKR